MTLEERIKMAFGHMVFNSLVVEQRAEDAESKVDEALKIAERAIKNAGDSQAVAANNLDGWKAERDAGRANWAELLATFGVKRPEPAEPPPAEPALE